MVYTTSLENQVFSLGQRINRLRAAQKVLTQENQFMIKTWAKTYLPTVIERDFPKPHPEVQQLANNSYTPQVNVLTALAWNQYPNQSFYRFYAALEAIDPVLAEAVYKHKLNFWILNKGDLYSHSPRINFKPIAIDDEQWCLNVPGAMSTNWDRDLDKAEEIRSALKVFRADVTSEIKAYLQKHDIEDKLTQYILPKDIFPYPIVIKEADEHGILTNHGELEWRYDDESPWEFINNGRGLLIGASQIVNSEMLPDMVKGERVFVLN